MQELQRVVCNNCTCNYGIRTIVPSVLWPT